MMKTLALTLCLVCITLSCVENTTEMGWFNCRLHHKDCDNATGFQLLVVSKESANLTPQSTIMTATKIGDQGESVTDTFGSN